MAGTYAGMNRASPSRSGSGITVRSGETVRPAESSAKAVFISSIASGIGTSSRTWLRVSTSIRRAPLVVVRRFDRLGNGV